MSEAVTVSLEYVYDRLICEFNHYDICLTGMIDRDGEPWCCWIENDDPENTTYLIKPVQWNGECDEYMSDYRIAYLHWFHDEKPRRQYGGWPLGWFRKKWNRRNPVEECTRTETS